MDHDYIWSYADRERDGKLCGCSEHGECSYLFSRWDTDDRGYRIHGGAKPLLPTASGLWPTTTNDQSDVYKPQRRWRDRIGLCDGFSP